MAKVIGDIVHRTARPARQEIGETTAPVILFGLEAPDYFQAVAVMAVASGGDDVVLRLDRQRIGFCRGTSDQQHDQQAWPELGAVFHQ